MDEKFVVVGWVTWLLCLTPTLVALELLWVALSQIQLRWVLTIISSQLLHLLIPEGHTLSNSKFCFIQLCTVYPSQLIHWGFVFLLGQMVLQEIVHFSSMISWSWGLRIILHNLLWNAWYDLHQSNLHFAAKLASLELARTQNKLSSKLGPSVAKLVFTGPSSVFLVLKYETILTKFLGAKAPLRLAHVRQWTQKSFKLQ